FLSDNQIATLQCTHLVDWHKSFLNRSTWVSRVKILRKVQVPTTGKFPCLYTISHEEVFKKSEKLILLPSEVYGTGYFRFVHSTKVGREYLACGGGSVRTTHGEVPARDDESILFEAWDDLTFVYRRTQIFHSD
ncbi:hypothetical protein PMAYCL1PPCAC_31307, partial [Pristionchus mayeri]